MTVPSNETTSLFPGESAGVPQQLCIEGTLESVTWRNGENGFTIAKLLTDSRIEVTVVGELLNPSVGEAMQLWGRWETHNTYGRQFRFVRYQVLRPATTQAMERYLGSGMIKGVGEKTAKTLVRFFGADTLDIIEHNPERLKEVPGIGKKTVKSIITGWAEQREVREIMLFLQGHGISANYAMKIYKQYGDNSIDIVTANPYRLARDIFGIGFKMADRIALQIGLAADTPERIEAGVIYSLQQSSEQGHCYMPERELAKLAAEILTPAAQPDVAPIIVTEEAALESIERLVRAQLVIRDTEDRERSPIYLKKLFVMEQALARGLKGMLKDSAQAWAPPDTEEFVTTLCADLGVNLADLQRTAVLDTLQHRVLILTGGPGTGKTTTTRAILEAQLRCKRKVLLASPTGRAAKRLTEVTGETALTIHRLLEVDPTSFTFKRNQDHTLECDTVIIDEVSMVDLQLAFSLVRALPKDAQLILVGDADQLPSVGAGNVLRDLIDSGEVPVVRLTEVFRQAAESTIITNAHRVNHGEMPELTPTRQWQSSDCLYISQDESEVAAHKIADVVARSLPMMNYAREDIQVLTPMIRGVLGTQNLNQLLQHALNPKQMGVLEFTRGLITFRCGDRVIQTVNDYNKDVFNGDIGYIRNINPAEKEFIVEYPEKEVTYSFDNADALALAYALTVHKSQGSEYPAVVLAFHTQHYLLLQRNLLYTALTRARKLAVIIGSRRALGIAVNNDKVVTRNTRLKERLQAVENVLAVWES